jgi:membrane associated rhomboid family serine protease
MEKSEPIFNIPRIIVTISLLFCAVHLLQYIPYKNVTLHDYLGNLMAFNPLYFSYISDFERFPLGFMSFMTAILYSLFHLDYTHLLLNSVMFIAFGTPISKRLNAPRFILFCLIMALFGAIAHTMGNFEKNAPVIGASAITSGLFAACLRLPNFGAGEFATAQPLTLKYIFTSQVHILNIVIWLVTNYLFGAGIVDLTGDGTKIAWQAHVGGFVAGFMLLPLFSKQSQ